MSATEILEMVYRLMPAAFLADFLVFTFGLWWLNHWRKLRAPFVGDLPGDPDVEWEDSTCTCRKGAWDPGCPRHGRVA